MAEGGRPGVVTRQQSALNTQVSEQRHEDLEDVESVHSCESELRGDGGAGGDEVRGGGAGAGAVNFNQPENNPQMDMMMRMMYTMEMNRAASERNVLGLIEAIAARRNEEPQAKYHVMPDLSKSIGTFNGEFGQVAETWIDKLKNTAMLNSWPDEFTLQTADMNLVGPAIDWYQAKRSELRTWQRFEQAFRKSFCVKQSLTESWQRMTERVQEAGETAANYFLAKNKLCKVLKLAFVEVKEQVLRGLRDRALVQSLLGKDHCDEDELLHDIVSFSSILGSDEKAKKIVQSAQAKTSANLKNAPKPSRDTSSVKCWNCLAKGHYSSACQKPKSRKCYRCGSDSHVLKDCPVKVEKEDVKKEVNVITSAPIEKYLRKVSVNLVELQAMVDCGSAVCTVKESIARKCKWVTEEKAMELCGFGNSKVMCEKVTYANVKVDEVELVDVPTWIVPDEAQSVDVIIGRSFTENSQVVYFKFDDNLFFVEKESFKQEFPGIDLKCKTLKVRSAETAKVPAESMMFIASMVDGQEVTTPVMNYSMIAKTVKKGDVVARVNSVCEGNMDDCVPERITEEMLNVSVELSPKELNSLLSLCNAYRSCFAFSLSELGCAKGYEMTIRDNNIPVRSKPYKATMKERETIANIVKEWKAEGIVTETQSEYASPVILVKKKTGEPRLVVDYRRLNKQTAKVPYPIPTLDEHFERLNGCKFFTTLDLAHGFLQLPLSDESKPKTGFITPDETGQFERTTFGLVNSPYEFCRVIQSVLGPLRHKVCTSYIDDLLIGAKTWDEMLSKLEEVFQALKNGGLTLKLKKCVFGLPEVEFLGYVISEQGMKPGPRKIAAVKEFEVPKNVHDVRAFLGLTGYFRRFVKNYASRSRPLCNLLKKGTVFKWGPEEDESFRDLRDALCQEPVLKLYDPKAVRTELHTDASSVGLAGVLLQEAEDGKLHPVYYVSKKTTEVEAKYHSTKLELMAVVWAIERLRNLLLGIKFVVVTDCQAIVFLNAGKTQNAQLTRWFDLLQEYDLEMKHRKGVEMSHVDALSRNPVEKSRDTLDEIHEKLEVLNLIDEDDYVTMIQYGDPQMREMIDIFKKEENERSDNEKQIISGYEFDRSRVWRVEIENGKRRKLYVIPKSARKSIVIKCHDLHGHFGVDRTVAKIRERYWFSGMRNYVKRHVQACIECLMCKIPGGKRPGELHPLECPRRPFERIHMDHVGPFQKTQFENMYIMVVICALTKFVKLYPVKTTKAREVIEKTHSFVNRYGVPRVIITDRGTGFTSQDFEMYCQELGTKHVLISSRWPQANGQVERVMRTLVPTIMTCTDAEDEWDVKIPEVERNLNTVINKTTGKTPFEVLHGYLPIFKDGIVVQAVDKDEEWVPPEEIQAEVQNKIKREQAKMKKRYDVKHYQGLKYDVGDVVVMRN